MDGMDDGGQGWVEVGKNQEEVVGMGERLVGVAE